MPDWLSWELRRLLNSEFDESELSKKLDKYLIDCIIKLFKFPWQIKEQASFLENFLFSAIVYNDYDHYYGDQYWKAAMFIQSCREVSHNSLED